MKTYMVENQSASLELERKIQSHGYYYDYNTIKTSRFLMQVGNKTYSTIIVNQGRPFLFAFVTLSLSQVVEGKLYLNPHKYLITGFNDDSSNKVTNIIAQQGQRELDKRWNRSSETLREQSHTAYLINYWKTCYLAKPFQQQPDQCFDRSSVSV